MQVDKIVKELIKEIEVWYSNLEDRKALSDILTKKITEYGEQERQKGIIQARKDCSQEQRTGGKMIIKMWANVQRRKSDNLIIEISSIRHCKRDVDIGGVFSDEVSSLEPVYIYTEAEHKQASRDPFKNVRKLMDSEHDYSLEDMNDAVHEDFKNWDEKK